MVIEKEIIIIGGGPAGLCAAISSAESGADVLIIDRNNKLGGQLVKQTHMFFGSEKQYASTRGIDIVKILLNKVLELKDKIEIMTDAYVLGMYEDNVITVLQHDDYIKFKPKSVVVATGAFEKSLAFINNDLPGIYGAGAVQTLMNVHGVKPGNKVLMVGAGNIGLIVSYQLLQAGVDVVAILDAAPKIGGYLVHAAKVRRMGVPILVSHTVKEAIGKNCLERVVVCEVDNKFHLINGTERIFDVDVMCISVGLTPLGEVLCMRGCEMKYVAELSGFVPLRTEDYETTVKDLFVAGDVCGVEEASSAMVEGYIAGLNAARNIRIMHKNYSELVDSYKKQLSDLRGGNVGKRIISGIEKIII